MAQRVQNLRLWKAFAAKRADMAEDIGGDLRTCGVVNEAK